MGFLAPHNLFWAASIALLVLIYLRSRSQPTLEVSSLLLFEEAPAPVASVRHARLDLLFWIEVAGLAALSLAVSGLYALWPSAGARARTHALVFDLAAGMTAVEHDRPRLSAARDAAQAVIASASPDDEFCVIGYALDANLVLAPTANRDSVNRAIASLRASAVPARDSALRAAMMRAANAAEIELFTDRDPPPAAIGGISSRTAVHVHRIGESADNVAVVSLDPGVPGRVRGRAVLRNFSVHPRLCQFAVDIEGRELYNQSLVFAPREQATISFGPLNDGGLLRARILTPDAIEADNQRWAWAAPGDAQDVLVLSPDAGVRDDLARLLLAINSTLRVEAADAAHFTPAGKRYALAVMHDSYAPGIRAGALLFIYPPLAQNLPPYLKITSTAPSSQMRVGQVTSAPILLDSARVMQFPEWMEPLARASRPHNAESFVAAAYGRAGRIGVLGFDIRDHF
ncbi:MAG TPA: VWA domain-containing protein, partial [Candidatus Binataceae bacterium]|nr:VWA domain-containing protein [Candidatus Binataceae bacterium]